MLSLEAFRELISTHAPAGGATHSNVRHMRMETHFYSRPCGRGDAAVISDLPSHVISTHAPAGGATNMSLNDGSPTIFLLTPLREGRPTIRAMQTHAATISTHAPAGGATLVMQWELQLSSYFYSRPCGRGDVIYGGTATISEQFLLTPLREGRRHVVCVEDGTYFISTHAPAGGATGRAGDAHFGLHISTHAPAGGAT